MAGRLRTALLVLVLFSGPALAAPPLIEKGEAPALAGWSGFCERSPVDCAVDLAESRAIRPSRETLEVIGAVNRYVNRTIDPVTDRERWGVEDVWDFPSDGKGDCEDFQLLKRKLLVEAGIPRRAMRMTVVINELGEGHAVLTVRTDGDDLILDNRTDAILSWSQTGYAFIKRESADRTGWVFLEPNKPAAVVTAAAQ